MKVKIDGTHTDTALIRRRFAQLAGVATLKVPFMDKNGQLADWKQWDPSLQDIGEFYDH